MTIVLVCLTLGVLTAASVFADRRFRALERIPMQWGLGGKVNWTAPRRIGLAFTPVLAALVLTAMSIVPGDQARTDSSVALTVAALVFVAAHLLHLYLIARSTR